MLRRSSPLLEIGGKTWCETGVTSAVESSYQRQRFLERGSFFNDLYSAPCSHLTPNPPFSAESRLSGQSLPTGGAGAGLAGAAAGRVTLVRICCPCAGQPAGPGAGRWRPRAAGGRVVAPVLSSLGSQRVCRGLDPQKALGA